MQKWRPKEGWDAVMIAGKLLVDYALKDKEDRVLLTSVALVEAGADALADEMIAWLEKQLKEWIYNRPDEYGSATMVVDWEDIEAILRELKGEA